MLVEDYPERWLPLIYGGLTLAAILAAQVLIRRRWRGPVVLAVVLAWLALVETAASVSLAATPTDPEGEFISDARRIWRPAPYLRHWETNSQGFRMGRELVAHDRPRVVCVGDSWTFGTGVQRQEAWPAQVEALTGVEVVNAGCPGYCLYQARLVLQEVDFPVNAVVVSTTRNHTLLPVFEGRTEDLQFQPTALLESAGYRWLRREVTTHLYRTIAEGPPPGPEEQASIARMHQRALDATLDLCASRGWPVLVLDVRGTQDTDAMYAVTARRWGLPAVEVVIGDEYDLPTDPWHPNAAGHEVIARAVAPLVRQHVR